MNGFWATVKAVLDGGLKHALGFAREALHLEFRTEEGRLNFLGMLVALVGMALIIVAGGVTDIVQAVRGHDSEGGTSPLQLGGFYLFWTGACMIMLLAAQAMGLLTPTKSSKENPEEPTDDPDA